MAFSVWNSVHTNETRRRRRRLAAAKPEKNIYKINKNQIVISFEWIEFRETSELHGTNVLECDLTNCNHG